MIHQEIALSSLHRGMKIGVDIRLEQGDGPLPIVIFLHGFQEFKDWGTFNQIANYFAEKSFIFIKFNFSHNGTTLGYPQQFVDLEAFARNNFSIEQDDLRVLLDFITSPSENYFFKNYDLSRLFVVGHGRGGSAAIVRACEDDRIRAVSSWAGPSHSLFDWDEETLASWKKKGVTHQINSRTEQKMPLYYQFIDDFMQHRDRFDLSFLMDKLTIPLSIVHAKDDSVVPVGMAYELKEWYKDAELLILDDGGHHFGGYHPFHDQVMPQPLLKAVEETEAFFTKISN